MRQIPGIVLCLLLLTAVAPGSGKSSGPYIGLHVEGEEYEGPRMVRPGVINGEKKYFRISPEVVTRHFGAFYAFMAEDGASYGAALRLNDEGRRAMAVMATNNFGRLARTIVNGKPLDVIRIDRPRDDGYFIIWGGLDAADLKLMSKKLDRLDEGLPGEKEKGKKRK
jgi:hypothetical protein